MCACCVCGVAPWCRYVELGGSGSSRLKEIPYTGLRWRDVGGKKPLVGEELVNEALSAALYKTSFTEEQWAAFGVGELDNQMWIQSDDGDYFMPLGTPPSGLRWIEIGDRRPKMGEEIKNAALATELAKPVEFTQAEWEAFGVCL